jgi:hypothetical protein
MSCISNIDLSNLDERLNSGEGLLKDRALPKEDAVNAHSPRYNSVAPTRTKFHTAKRPSTRRNMTMKKAKRTQPKSQPKSQQKSIRWLYNSLTLSINTVF